MLISAQPAACESFTHTLLRRNRRRSHLPIRKFELVRNKLLAEGTLDPSELAEPTPASIEDVRLVHTEDYVSRLCDGTLTDKEIRRLGLPWSESLVARSFYAVGGTIAAALQSLGDGYSSNLAGGTHHSFRSRRRLLRIE